MRAHDSCAIPLVSARRVTLRRGCVLEHGKSDAEGDVSWETSDIYDHSPASKGTHRWRLSAQRCTLRYRLVEIMPVKGLSPRVIRHLCSLGHTRADLHTQWRPRQVVAKVEFHFGELFPRVKFIVTNLKTGVRLITHARYYWLLLGGAI
jgi:hypothetical protein